MVYKYSLCIANWILLIYLFSLYSFLFSLHCVWRRIVWNLLAKSVVASGAVLFKLIHTICVVNYSMLVCPE